MTVPEIVWVTAAPAVELPRDGSRRAPLTLRCPVCGRPLLIRAHAACRCGVVLVRSLLWCWEVTMYAAVWFWLESQGRWVELPEHLPALCEGNGGPRGGGRPRRVAG